MPSRLLALGAAGTLLALLACAAPGARRAAPPAGGGVRPAGETMLRINGESYTLGELEELNPSLFGTRPHSSVFRAAWLERFINYRLVVQEARRRGLDGSPDFARLMDEVLDVEGARLLLKEALPVAPRATAEELKAAAEAEPGLSEEEAGRRIVRRKGREAIDALLASRGLSVPVTFLIQDAASIRSGPESEAVAQVGGTKVTLAHLRRKLPAAGEATGAEITSALEDLVWGVKSVEAARLGGWRDRIGPRQRLALEDKLLESLMVEKKAEGISVSEEEARLHYDSRARALLAGEPALPPFEQMRDGIVAELGKAKLRDRMRDMLRELMAGAAIWKSDKLDGP